MMQVRMRISEKETGWQREGEAGRRGGGDASEPGAKRGGVAGKGGIGGNRTSQADGGQKSIAGVDWGITLPKKGRSASSSDKSVGEGQE